MDFPNLAPGVYLISALTREAPQPQEVPIARGGAAPSPYGPGSRIMAGTTIVAVSDFDIDDAVVSLGPGGSFTGRLRVEGELPAPTGTAVRAAPQPPRFNVQLINLRGQSILDYEGMSTIQAAADGSFQFNSVMAGEYRVAVRNLPPGAYVKSANLDGVDILRTPFVLTGPSSGSLDIVVSAKSGQIRGSLVDERSETIPLMQVVLVPMRDRGRVELYKTVVTDEAGSFNMTGVPPGDYRMFSWQSIEPFSWFDPDVVSRFEDRGSPVHVSESSTENVQVRLISQGAAQ
jgi:hypothetical protein